MSTSFLTLPQPGAVNQPLSAFAPPLKTAPAAPAGWSPLVSYQIASFSTAEAVLLPKGTELYRIYGGLGEASATGHYWSLEPPPTLQADWRAGSAVLMTFNDGTQWEKATVKVDGGAKAWKGAAAPQMAEDIFGNPLSGWSLKGGATQILLETPAPVTVESLLDRTPMGDTPWDSFKSSAPFAPLIAELLSVTDQLQSFTKANPNYWGTQTLIIQAYEINKVAGELSALTSSAEVDKYEDLVESMLLNLQGICNRINTNLQGDSAASAQTLDKVFQHTLKLLKAQTV